MPTPHAFSPAARRLLRQIVALGAGLLTASVASAVDYYKADNLTSPTNPASWWLDAAGTIPATDNPVNTTSPTAVCIWNDLVTGPQELAVPDVGMQVIRILNPAGPISIAGSGGPKTITVGNGGGIDMSLATQDLTLASIFHRIAASGASISLNVAAGRTLTYGAAAQINVRNNASGATVNINTDGTSAGTVTFAANVAASHVVVGAGHVEFNNLSGNNRLSTNSTTLNGGVTLVNNTSGSGTGSGAVAVNANATLGGTGIISGAVTAAADSILSPGVAGVGTLTVGGLTLEAGGNLVWEAANSVDADLLAVTAADGLILNGGVLHLHNPGTTEPFNGTGVFTLVSYVGAIGGAGLESLTIAEESKIPGRTYTLGLGAGVITLEIEDGTVTPIDWAVDASGNWSLGANWTGGAAPDAVKAVARITGETGATFTAPRTVTLDSPRTVGRLFLNSAQSVTLDGSATLTLDQGGGPATFFSSGANHTVNAPLTLSPGGVTTTVDGAGETLTLAGAISGLDLGLVKIGDGTLLLTADNTYTGSTSVSAGTLQLGDGGTTGSVAGALATSGTVRFNRSDSVSLAAPISGTGDVQFVGTGDTTLTVANTYSGDTTLSAGTLILADGQALQNSTLTYATGGGSLVVADPVVSVTLGALAGDRAFPLTNTLGAPIALTVGGNNAATAYSGSPIGTGVSFTKNGTGALVLTGTHAYAGDTTVNAGLLSLDPGASFTTAAANLGSGSTAKILVNGGTLNASASSLVKNSTGGLQVAAGVANFTGGIVTDANSSSNSNFIHVSGGVLNAASISTSRGSLNHGSEPGNGQTTQGLYINGGEVNVTGALDIGAISGANSSVSSRMDSGSLAVGGPLTLGINNTSRWSVLDINGGTLTSTDAADGIRLGSAFVGNVVMHIRGSSAVVKAERIQFGQAALAGSAFLNLSNGALYVGSGGLVLGSSSETFVAGLRLNSGKLGATADWSSTLPMTLNGLPTVITGADEADAPHTVTLHGPATGLGALDKNGSGTVLLTSPANDYFGPTNINGGTLGLAGKTSDVVTVNTGGTLAPQGVLIAEFGVTLDGGLAIGYQAGAETPVSRLESTFGSVTLGASSTLSLGGTGVLPGPAHVIVKAAGGVSGTFATVTGMPEGFTLDYNYDDGSGVPVVAIVGAGVGTPYDDWATTYSLVGDDALPAADPDGDGLANLLEYAFSTSPVAGDASDAFALGRSGNFLILSFLQPGDASLTYTVEASNDLAGAWSTVHTFDPFTVEGPGNYTDTVDLATAPRRFLRLRVTTAP